MSLAQNGEESISVLVPEVRGEVFAGDVAGAAVDDEAGLDGGVLRRSGEGHVCR